MPAETVVEKVVSRDGTPIAIERLGKGRPLLLVHGTSSKRGRWAPIQAELAEGRELVWMDRRGRGDSGDGADYAIEREFEDVAAVADHLGGAVDIFGHSYGGICALMVAGMTGAVARLALYEPPIGVIPADQTASDTIDRLVAEGDLSGGLETFLRSILKVPEARIADMRAAPDWELRLDVVPTIARELRAVAAFMPDLGRLAATQNPTLLVLGSDSAPPFKAAIDLLALNLPRQRLAVLPGQQHQAIDTAPDLLVEAIKPFLSGQA